MKINRKLSEIKDFEELDEEEKNEHLILERLVEEIIMPYFEALGYTELVKKYFDGDPRFSFLNGDKLRIVHYSYFTNFESRIFVRINQYNNKEKFDEWQRFATWNSSSLDWYLQRKYKITEIDGIPIGKLFYLSYYSGENFEEKLRNVLKHTIEVIERYGYVKDIISGKKDLDYSELSEKW